MSEIAVAALDSHSQKLWESAQRACGRQDDGRVLGLCREILAVVREASVAQTMRRGRWGEEGDYRAKVRQSS